MLACLFLVLRMVVMTMTDGGRGSCYVLMVETFGLVRWGLQLQWSVWW